MKSLPLPPDQPTKPCQLTLALDARKLQGLNAEQRDAVLGALVDSDVLRSGTALATTSTGAMTVRTLAQLPDATASHGAK